MEFNNKFIRLIILISFITKNNYIKIKLKPLIKLLIHSGNLINNHNYQCYKINNHLSFNKIIHILWSNNNNKPYNKKKIIFKFVSNKISKDKIKFINLCKSKFNNVKLWYLNISIKYYNFSEPKSM